MTKEEKEAIRLLSGLMFKGKLKEALDMAIKALEQEPRKGHWLRMSDLSEYEDDRYKCSRCGNVIHHKNEMDLYTFNSWCGRCGSDNGRQRMKLQTPTDQENRRTI